MTSDFFNFEDREYDLPFLSDDSRFSTKNVIILLIGFLIALAMPFIIPPTGNTFLKAIILTLAPLLAVVYVFKGDMSNIFRMPKPRDILTVIIGVIVMFACAVISNIIIASLGITALSDSAINGSALLLLIRAVIQLLGEELIKFIPLIIVSAYLYKSIGRKAAIIAAIIISQIIFALFHIPAYGFSILFLLLHIGFTSIALPFVYVKTKNLVLCYIIHLINDLFAFLPYLMGNA